MKNTLFFSLALTLSSTATATTAPIGPVYIEMVAAIELPTAGHISGNLEIKIRDGFVIPAGLSCNDTNYITTLKINDANKRMFTLLTMAKLTNQPVLLYISDDPAYTAIGNRCSLTAVILA